MVVFLGVVEMDDEVGDFVLDDEKGLVERHAGFFIAGQQIFMLPSILQPHRYSLHEQQDQVIRAYQPPRIRNVFLILPINHVFVDPIVLIEDLQRLLFLLDKLFVPIIIAETVVKFLQLQLKRAQKPGNTVKFQHLFIDLLDRFIVPVYELVSVPRDIFFRSVLDNVDQ